MTAARTLKVFSELRDLEIFDRDGELCGVADDVEFTGAPGGPLRVAALLAGPGAFRRRLPRVLGPMVSWIAGDGMVRVPWEAVEHVTSRITLNRAAEDLGLAAVERRLAPLLKKIPPG
jgi:sporulation protein YlmC with PRC-barrel domain